MPTFSNLLAEITGEKPKPPVVTVSSRPVPLPKRKAEDEAKGPAVKVQRTTPPTSTSAANKSTSSLSGARQGESLAPSSSPTLNLSIPNPTKNGSNSNHGALSANRPPASSTPKPVSRGGRLQNGNKDAVAANRALPSAQHTRPGQLSSPRDNSPAAPKTAPKKGSFQEIMKRAADAQQRMSQVGKIQHKPLEKAPSKRERMEMKAAPSRAGVGKNPAKRTGLNRASGVKDEDRDRDMIRGIGSTDSRSNPTGKSMTAVAAANAKKPKKAATATTGYQGTARPPPGATAHRGSLAPASGSSNGARGPDRERRLPFSGSRNRKHRNDDYDEEMDDFIDYDEEEEPEEAGGYGRRHTEYSDEDESDMEAGLSDIDEEERRAEYYGRREDQEQEALEQKLKREKEERKRRLMGAAASKRR